MSFVRCDAPHPRMSGVRCQLRIGHVDSDHASFVPTPPDEPQTRVARWPEYRGSHNDSNRCYHYHETSYGSGYYCSLQKNHVNVHEAWKFHNVDDPEGEMVLMWANDTYVIEEIPATPEDLLHIASRDMDTSRDA